jgi:hypothetical protein
MADPPSGTSVNVELVMLPTFMASLKVAVTAEVIATLVLAFVGVTELTVGAATSAVVNDHV